jgi:hypothetical protein
MAYRVADSPPNIVTPLMPYFALIVVFAQRYDKNAGVGTVVAMMLPCAEWWSRSSGSCSFSCGNCSGFLLGRRDDPTGIGSPCDEE